MSARAGGHALAQSSPGLLEALPLALYTTDAEGRITFHNQAATRLWGRKPELHKERWCGAVKLWSLDGQRIAPHSGPIAAALESRKPVRAEAVLEQPGGARVAIVAECTPLFDDDGTLTGSINMLLDVTGQRQAEHSQAHLSAIVESSEDAILSKNLDGIIQSWNRGAERVFGYTAEEAVGRPVLMLIPQGRHNEEPEILARIRRGELVDHFETVRRRKDGSLIDISLTISPVRNMRGEIVGASKIARDISDTRRAQLELQRLHEATQAEMERRKRTEETKDILLHEIKHRVKNTLGTVQAIASQTFRTAPKPEREAFGARLRALSEAHDLLTNQDWGDVEAGEVVRRAIAPFGPQRFTLAGDAGVLGASSALLLAMAVHELSTNAVKYGALSNADGRVAIHWRACDKRLEVEWRESGGPPVVPPLQKGFGSNLIERTMQRENGEAQFDYAPDGLKVRLEIRR